MHWILSKKKGLVLLAFGLGFHICQAQTHIPHLKAGDLASAHERYRETAITHRRVTHEELQPLIQKHAEQFRIKHLGTSVLGRSINSLDWGSGPTKVMLWSQMHGNESTATMALFDVFNFLEGTGDQHAELREVLRSQLQLKFIPMLNPDGAAVFKRRNALDIDLNRDAISLISPEAELLKNARDDFEPEFGFNLHDQQIYYNVANTPKQATISLLAPAYNAATEINEVRKRAMQTIVGMNELLQEVVPGQVGKYDDAFEPRAFGDNIQKWGTSTILIESGGLLGDPEKQEIRKINFMILLNALHTIATKSYTQYETADYFKIPDNAMQLMDLVINEVQVPVNDTWFSLDLAIRRREIETPKGYFHQGTVEDIGDMQVFFGMETFDATGLKYQAGQVFPTPFDSVDEVTLEMAMKLLRQGYISIKVNQGSPRQLHGLPLVVLKSGNTFSGGWSLDTSPNFFMTREGELSHAVVNGYLIDLNRMPTEKFRNRIF